MATRYAGEFEFDHGAQFFTARTPAFRNFLQPLVDAGVVADWPVTFVELDGERIVAERAWGDDDPHYVGAPRMNSIGAYLSTGLDVRCETTVAAIQRSGAGWSVSDTAHKTLGRFDWVVLTPPARQTAALARDFPAVVSLCAQRQMLGCFALMLGLAEPPGLPWQAARVHDDAVSWISLNSSKPGRGAPTLVVHSSNAWADAHIDDDPGSVREHLLDAASRITGTNLRAAAEHTDLHRWRYANITKQTGPACFVDDDAQLAVCGDWFVRGKIEAAFTSADELGRQLLDRL